MRLEPYLEDIERLRPEMIGSGMRTLTMEEAEDAFQDTVLQIARTDSFDGSKRFVPWFWRCFRNKCVDYQRKNDGNPTVNLTGLESQGPDSHDYLDFDDKINNLDPRLAPVIGLFYYHEMTYSEISSRLRRPGGTLRSQMREAKDILKRSLKDYNVRAA